MDYFDLIEAAFDRVDIYNGPEVFFAEFSKLPLAVQHLLAAHWCQSEINNGGFDQFFWNPTGVLAPEGEAGFRAMGLTAVADLVASAIARFGSVYPRDREERIDAMGRLPSDGGRAFGGSGRRFGDLDDHFYELLPNFHEPADRYAAANGG